MRLRVYNYTHEQRRSLKRLKTAGWTEVSVRGSHHKLRNESGKVVIVPHPKKDLPIGTVKAIFKQAGLDWSKK